MKILLAEDSLSVAALMQARLTDCGHEVVLAKNGQVAIELFTANAPDLVLMDLDMPVMDGIAATRAIREFEATQQGWTPIIFLTSSDRAEDLVQAIDAGGDDYLLKPVDQNVLLAKIKSQHRLVALRSDLSESREHYRVLADKHSLAEAALRQSEARWRFALEGSGDGVWEYDFRTNVNVVSGRMLEILGFGAQIAGSEHQANDWAERLHPESLVRTMQAMDSVIHGGIDAYIVEQQVRCEDGSFKWLLTRGMVEGRDDAGAPLRMVGTSADITDRKNADERQIRAVLEAAPDGMLLVAGDGVIRFANNVAARLFAYPQQELIGQSVDILVPTAIRAGHRQKRESFAGNPTSRPMAANAGLQAVRRNQEAFPVEISLSPFVLNAEQLVIVSVTDISERVKAEQALAAAHRHTQLILNSVGEGIYGVDAEGTITFVNPQAIQLFGHDQDELIGKSSHALFHHTRSNGEAYPAQECKVHDAIQSGLLHRISDEVFWRKDGTSFPVEYVSAPILHEGRAVGAVVSFRDITERKAAENALRDLNENLEQRVTGRTSELAAALDHAELAKRSRGEFLANMSHEIRTPMNAVLGMVYLALRTDPAPKQRDYLEKIQQSGEHLLGIINDILDFSKIDAGKLDLEYGDFDLDRVIRNITQLTEGKAVEKGLSIDIDVAPVIPRRLRGDALRLGQILINFVNNAVKFTDTGGVMVRVGWSDESIALSDGEVVLRFEVEDSGIGLNEEQQSRLFQSFEQADNSTTRKYGGTGLGLAISKQLVQLMGGDVGVVSAPGAGSTFWFTARLQIASSRSEAPDNDEAQVSLDGLRGANILVVDDNAFNLEVAKGILEDIGIQVALAPDGADAVTMLRESRFDCVLMDVHMPVMNGLEATRTIRADPELAGICVIAMTANARREDRDECLAAGMDDVVTKPINPDHLFATLAKWLRLPVDEAVEPPDASAADMMAPEPVTADIDFDVLRKLVKNNPEKMRMFVKLFIDGADKGMSDIDAALLAGDGGTLANVGHRIKSSARSIGAAGFGDLCHRLEEFGLAAEVASAADLRNAMHETLNRIRDQVAQELG